MDTNIITIDHTDARKLVGAANANASLLYIYLKAGNDPRQAGETLKISENNLACAFAVLRQLGLWDEKKQKRIIVGERPCYTANDVIKAQEGQDPTFRNLCGEVQTLMGRNLTTEDMKVLLGIVNYLGMPNEVISLLIYYCKERNRRHGNPRNPSLRVIEKEAYFWAENGIDTMEEASAYIQKEAMKNTRIGQLKQLLQIYGRELTSAEEKYAFSWIEMGFEDDVIFMAYEKTCLKTGGLNWGYMNAILKRWHDAGYKTAEEVHARGRKASARVHPGFIAPAGQYQPDADQARAIARMFGVKSFEEMVEG